MIESTLFSGMVCMYSKQSEHTTCSLFNCLLLVYSGIGRFSSIHFSALRLR